MSDLDELKAEWFEFGRKSGKAEATERIIKLLEAHDWSYLEIEASEIISVLKGKTND